VEPGGFVEIRDTCTVDAPAQRVWDALLDPDVVIGCIPGGPAVERVGQDEFAANVSVRVGPFPVTLTICVVVEDKRPPQSCTVRATVDGAGSTARGVARLRLEDAERLTAIHVEGEAEIGGALSLFEGLATRDAVSRGLERFFECVAIRCREADTQE